MNIVYTRAKIRLGHIIGRSFVFSKEVENMNSYVGRLDHICRLISIGS